jgi:hypothetical protein
MNSKEPRTVPYNYSMVSWSHHNNMPGANYSHWWGSFVRPRPLSIVHLNSKGQIQEFKKKGGVQWNFLQKGGGGVQPGQFVLEKSAPDSHTYFSITGVLENFRTIKEPPRSTPV